MYAGCGLAGDLAGDPLALGSQSISWISRAHQTLRARWTAPVGAVADVAYTLYRDGVIFARNVLPPFDVPVLVANVIPNIAAVAVAPGFELLSTYDPILSQDLVNIFSLVALMSLNTGIYTAPVETLREMLSVLPSVQALLQAPDAETALDYLIAFGEMGDQPRPFILVNIPESNRESRSRGRFQPQGKLTLQIEVPFVWSAPVTTSVTNVRLNIAAFVGYVDDFFTGFTLTTPDGSAEIIGFDGATGLVQLGTGFTNPIPLATVCKLTVPNIDDAMNFFLRTVEQIQLELENSIADGPMTINAIRMNDYGRVLPEQTEDVYGGAKLECDFGV